MSVSTEAQRPFTTEALLTEVQQSEPAAATSLSRLSDLFPRLASGLVLMVLALAGLWLGGLVFSLFWLAATIALFWEWQTIIGGTAKPTRLALGIACLILITLLVARQHVELAGLVLVASAALLAFLNPTARAWTAGGMLYAGCFIASLCLLTAEFSSGRLIILWLFAIVWGTDICAYFIGRLLGGPKIWPRLSPKKTWSGTLGGITCGAALGALVDLKFDTPPVSFLLVFGFSLVTAAFSQGGDLFESWMKRQFGVKDSSHLIPGHGGFLDRLDGFVAAVVFVALIAGLFGLGVFPPNQN